MKWTTFALGLVAISACQTSTSAPATPAPSTAQTPAASQRNSLGFWVRSGYVCEEVASNLGNARFMEFGDKSELYMSRPAIGDILTLKPKGNKYEVAGTFISGKRTVHGLCFRGGWLYYSTTGAIYKARDTNGDGVADEDVAVIAEGVLPSGGGHWWRPVLVADQHIFTSIGDSGNISDQRTTDRQKIWRFNLDGSGKTLWSEGIRNTEKLRFRPGTQELWGIDHGSDWFGGPYGDKTGMQPITDLNPPCEINLYEQGKFYGHPFIVGNRVPRLEFKDKVDLVELAAKTVPPAWSLGAHWAPNGFCFATKTALGADVKGDMFVACHGSWNSSAKVGYRIERVMFDEETNSLFGGLMIVGTISESGKVLARPVDCVEEPSGNILWSCDQTNKIYRIRKASNSPQ